MRKELDTLQRKVKSFDVTTEYALADSDVIAPTTGWGADKPSYQTGKFIWVRNTLHTGYGDIVLEPYNIGDGQEHILSLTMEYAVSNDAFTEPTGSWVANAPTLSEGQYLWTRTKIVTNFGTTTTSAIRMTGEKGITGDAISIKGDTGDEGKGYDFIYYTSEYDTAPTTPSKNVVRNEGVYEAWCDYPCSVTDKYKYTYMSMRTSDNGEWGNWSTPTLMSSIGEKGEDGEGYEIIFRQTTTNTPPTFNNGENLHTFIGKVNGKSFNDNDFVPTDWSDDSNGVNSTYKYEYASMRTKTNGLWSDFSSPSLWNIYSESTYTHIRYSSVNNPSSISQTTTTPTSNTAYIGIYVDKKESETFSSYSWKKWIPMEGIDYDGRFLHIRYSNDEGTTFTDGDVGGSYMGICYSYTSTAPDNPEAYTWSRIRGSDGAGMEFAYYSSATEQTSLSAPTTVRTGTPQANNWYERPYGVTEQIQYCYVSTKPTGGSSWGTPVLWAKYGATGQQGGVGERGEDGIGLEQIFCRTDADGYIVDNTGTRLTIDGNVRKLSAYSNAQPHTWSAVSTDDYFDETKGWYDNPVGVTENCPYEYVAQRMKTVTNKTNPNQANYKVAVWGKFNVYSQWSNYSEDGVSITGTTVYYAQTEDYTNAPTSPSAWKEGTPQTYEAGKFYWVKQIIHYDNGSSDETAPICVSGVDGQGVHFVYYCGNVIPTKPTDSGSVVPNGSTDSDYDKWVEEPVSPTSDDPYLFMSQSTDYNYQTGKWTNFSTPAQIGTYSTDGTTVKTEWRYLTKADTSTPSTSGGDWSTTPVAVTSAKPYCFITSRIVTGNTNGNWSTPVLWSRYANDGDRGTGIFTLTSYTESSASMTGNPDVKYKISKSTITNQIGSITLLVGDQLRTGYYIYPVLASDNTYYYLGEKSNIRGEKGDDGVDGDKFYEITTQPLSANPPNKYRIAWANVDSSIRSNVKVGDIFKYGTSLYPVTHIWAGNYIYFGEKTDLKGDKGNTGDDGDGEEMIYCITESDTPPTPPSNPNTVIRVDSQTSSERSPNVWYNEPVPPQDPYKNCWVSKRVYTENGWLPYQDATLFNYVTRDGITQIVETTITKYDESKLTGKEIMAKIENEVIDAQSVGGIKPSEILTNELTTIPPYSDGGNGHIYVNRQGNACSVTLENYYFTVLSMADTNRYNNNPVVTLPSWATPLSVQYLANIPVNSLHRLRINSSGVLQVYPENTSVGNSIALTGTFTYIVSANTGFETRIVVSSSNITSSGAYTITLQYKNSNGNWTNIGAGFPIVFNINGVGYGRTTNSNSQASINLNLPEQNDMSITTIYNGNSQYRAITYTDNNVDITASTNTLISFTTSNNITYAVITASGHAMRNLPCKLSLNGDTLTANTDSEGRINLTNLVSNIKGTVNVTVETNDSKRCSYSKNTEMMIGGKQTELITVSATPARFEESKTVTVNGITFTGTRQWSYIVDGGTTANINDGSYSLAYNIPANSSFYALKMLCPFSIPNTAIIKSVRITLRYASLLGQTSYSKGSFTKPYISLMNNAEELDHVFVGDNLYRLDTGSWRTATYSWDISDAQGTNHDGRWNTTSIRLNPLMNSGGKESASGTGYGNNASYGIDYLNIEIVYEG